MASVRTSRPVHQQPGPKGEPFQHGLADAQANYDGATRYETRLRGEGREQGLAEGRTEGRVEGRDEGMRLASECAARIVEDMPLIGGRQRAADRIRRECS